MPPFLPRYLSLLQLDPAKQKSVAKNSDTYRERLQINSLLGSKNYPIIPFVGDQRVLIKSVIQTRSRIGQGVPVYKTVDNSV
jgi:hypothetical protein